MQSLLHRLVQHPLRLGLSRSPPQTCARGGDFSSSSAYTTSYQLKTSGILHYRAKAHFQNYILRVRAAWAVPKNPEHPPSATASTGSATFLLPQLSHRVLVEGSLMLRNGTAAPDGSVGPPPGIATGPEPRNGRHYSETRPIHKSEARVGSSWNAQLRMMPIALRATIGAPGWGARGAGNFGIQICELHRSSEGLGSCEV